MNIFQNRWLELRWHRLMRNNELTVKRLIFFRNSFLFTITLLKNLSEFFTQQYRACSVHNYYHVKFSFKLFDKRASKVYVFWEGHKIDKIFTDNLKVRQIDGEDFVHFFFFFSKGFSSLTILLVVLNYQIYGSPVTRQ